jgi:hypothetical protein
VSSGPLDLWGCRLSTAASWAGHAIRQLRDDACEVRVDAAASALTPTRPAVPYGASTQAASDIVGMAEIPVCANSPTIPAWLSRGHLDLVDRLWDGLTDWWVVCSEVGK